MMKKKCSEHKNHFFLCNLLYLQTLALSKENRGKIGALNVFSIIADNAKKWTIGQYLAYCSVYRQSQHQVYKSYQTSDYWQNVRHFTTSTSTSDWILENLLGQLRDSEEEDGERDTTADLGEMTMKLMRAELCFLHNFLVIISKFLNYF